MGEDKEEEKRKEERGGERRSFVWLVFLLSEGTLNNRCYCARQPRSHVSSCDEHYNIITLTDARPRQSIKTKTYSYP